MLADADLMRKCIKRLYPHVIYAEDHMYRFMTYSGVPYKFFPVNTVLYEWGTGISTISENIWKERLKKDWNEADKILTFLECDNPRLKRLVKTRIKMKNQRCNLARRIFGIIHLPGYYVYRIRLKVNPRYSRGEVNIDFVNELIQIDT